MIFKEHLAFVPPETSEQKIWRYMDFTKFVSMLARQCLYFTSLKKLSDQDPFEGLFPDTYFECRAWKTVEDIPERERWRLTCHPRPGQTPLEMVQSQMEKFAKLVFHMRKTLFINCWHINNYDSLAMWSIYAGKGSGIAITSSYGALQASLRSERPLFGGKIEYSDYSTGIIETNNITLTTAMRKRRRFDFEREFRVVFWDDSSVSKPDRLKEVEKFVGPDGLEFPCDLSTLIDEIYVSPKSEGWFLDLVQSVAHTYGLNKEVRRSPSDKSPIVWRQAWPTPPLC
jgi:hypothetical protein